MLPHEPITVQVYSNLAGHLPPPTLGHHLSDPIRKSSFEDVTTNCRSINSLPIQSPGLDTIPWARLAETPMCHASPAIQCSDLHSLSTAQLLAQAGHLAGLLPPKPTKPPEPNRTSRPKGTPLEALTSAHYKKAANRVCPVRTTLPEDQCILC